MKRSYDTIAWFYDRLARLMYGNTLIETQRYLINHIPPASRIMIVGGGTGWILEEIAKLHPSGLTITYIDASQKMIDLAKERTCGSNIVTFITSFIEDLKPCLPAGRFENRDLEFRYDVVLTPFLFDNFTNSSLQKICSLIDDQVKPNALWLYCDFQNTGALWQRAILKVMYVFFRVSCGIESSRLPDAEGCFEKLGYKVISQKTFLKQFIIARVYQKD